MPLAGARARTESDAPVRDWLAGIRDGDEDAFNRFYDLFAARLYRRLFAIAPDDEALVRDAFQETLLRVVRYAKPLPSEDDAWRWLCRVGRSALYDSLRKRRRRRDREQVAARLERFEPEAGEDRLDAALRLALAELPAEDRALIDAFYFERAGQETIARRGDTTRKSVDRIAAGPAAGPLAHPAHGDPRP